MLLAIHVMAGHLDSSRGNVFSSLLSHLMGCLFLVDEIPS